MLPPAIRPQTIEYMPIVSLCVCTSSAQFVSNYSIGKSIRRVSPAALVVTGRSLEDMSQILKYIGYYVVTSAADTHILLKKNDEVKVSSVASNRNSILTAEIQVNSMKFKLVAASAINRELLVRHLKDSSGPLVLAGLFEGNPFTKSSQLQLASHGATLATRDEAQEDTVPNPPRITKSSLVPAIVLKSMVAHGTGTYLLGQSATSPYHIWSRVGT